MPFVRNNAARLQRGEISYLNKNVTVRFERPLRLFLAKFQRNRWRDSLATRLRRERTMYREGKDVIAKFSRINFTRIIPSVNALTI